METNENKLKLSGTANLSKPLELTKNYDRRKEYSREYYMKHRVLLGKNSKTWKHGLSDTRFHIIWQRIRQRCQNKNTSDYKWYGARGIKVCERWQDFLNFKQDMYQSYLKHCKKFGEKNTSIDRINPKDDYKLSNCRWATKLQQVRNSSHCHYIKFNNKLKCISEWAEITNLTGGTIKNRLNRGWSIKKTLLTPKYGIKNK